MLRAARAADAVHIILVFKRHIVVEDGVDIVHVDASRGHVGRNKDRQLAAAEARHNGLALFLRDIAVDAVGLKAFLMMEGLDVDCIHGDIPQKKREAVMARFRRGELPVFVATDVAARGIDVDDVDAVFNYDVPQENEYYVHRIGRTGRAKRRGVAYTLVSDYPSGMRLDAIAKFTGNEIKRAHLDENGKLTED